MTRVLMSGPQLQGLRLFSLLLCLLGLMLLQPAFAQNGDDSSEAQPPVGLSQLADIIENDETRAQLVSELRRAAGDGLEQAPAASSELLPEDRPQATDDEVKEAVAEQADASQERVSFARRFAQVTGAWAEVIGDQVMGAWGLLASLGEDDAGPRPEFDGTAFVNALISFALVVAATLASFFVLRLLAGGLFSAVGRFSRHGGTGFSLIVHRATAVLSALIIDVAVVLIASGFGYAAGLFLFGEQGAIGTRESLFINAFALIELCKVGIRTVFAARYENLRLIAMPSSVAGWWSIRLCWFVGIIGYGLLVAVPIINTQLSLFLGMIVSFLLMGGAYVYALTVIFKNRKLLTERLHEKATTASIGFFSILLRILARLWVILALAYFTTLFVASQIDPAGALPFMLGATLQTLIAAAVGLGLSGLLSKAIGKRFSFPEQTRQRLPMLENRVNSYVPTALKVARVIILVAFALVLADAWRLFDLDDWLASPAGLFTLGIIGRLAIVFIGAALLWVLLASFLEHKLTNNDGSAPSARQQTLMVLIRNALAIVIATMTLMVALAQIGVNIGPMIAGAGVIGLAVGFGAQSLVQDIITGVFIQLENSMNVGDVVTLAGVTGTAENLTIRSVAIRDLDGAYHVVPFSSAGVVTNYMREFAYHRMEYRVAYREDIDEAIQQLRAAFDELKSDPEIRPSILEDIAVPGVTALDDSSVNIRIMIKTLPGTQWGVGRAYNRLVKMHFDRAGIEIPAQRLTMYFGEDKDGTASPANLRVVSAPSLPSGSDDDKPNRKRQPPTDAAPQEGED